MISLSIRVKLSVNIVPYDKQKVLRYICPILSNYAMLQLPVYLDYNATTPCDPAVVEAMLPYFTQSFGNAASRSHAYGWQAEEAVTLAREQVAQLINAEPSEIVFTSGATEADNLALRGVADMYASKGNHIITTAIEHKAVLDTCKQLEKKRGRYYLFAGE